MKKGSLNLRIHENLAGVKRLTFSLIIVLLIISLSAPVYAPARRPDYIEWMPVVAVGDLELEYASIDVVGRQVILDQPSGIIGILVDLVCAGNATFTEADTEESYAFNFVQQMALKFVFTDGSVHLGDTVSVSGNSNLTLFSAERQISFKCVVYGNATFTDVGPLDYGVEIELSLRGNSSLGPIVSLQIEGTLSFPDWNLTLIAEGQILSFSRFPGNF
jgi:hypothetical protein